MYFLKNTNCTLAFIGKRIIFLLMFAIFLYNHAFTQTRIEDAIKTHNKHKFKSIDELATFINNNADNDREKAYGAYYWIATNVVYDVKKFMKGKPSYYTPEKVFEKKKAVCEGYANLYKALCKKMNLTCEVIAGYSKGYGYQAGKPFTEADHAWNAVKIDSVWQLIDVTWAAGSIKRTLFGAKFIMQFNNDFFFLPPKEFVMTHLPEVPMWQLLNNPVPIKIFASSNEKIYAHFKSAPAVSYNYKDTLQKFFNLKEPEKPVEYGEMAFLFNPQNVVPFALSVVAPLKYKLENSYYLFHEKKIQEIDSLITLCTNAIELLKKSKTSKKSVKELIEINLINGYEVLSELLFIKAEMMDKKKAIADTYELLLVQHKPVVEALERALVANKETKNTKQFEKVDIKLCSAYKNYFEIFSALLSKEKDELKKKTMQKEIKIFTKNAQKIVSAGNTCFKYIGELNY